MPRVSAGGLLFSMIDSEAGSAGRPRWQRLISQAWGLAGLKLCKARLAENAFFVDLPVVRSAVLLCFFALALVIEHASASSQGVVGRGYGFVSDGWTMDYDNES